MIKRFLSKVAFKENRHSITQDLKSSIKVIVGLLICDIIVYNIHITAS